MQKHIESLISHFEACPLQLADEYKWPRGKNPIPFDETFSRRAHDAKRFSDEPACKTDIAIKMIKWGGITRGLDKIPQMAHENPEQLIARGLKRVASWSKILTLHDPEHYLIYDARVAFSLNYIFHISSVTDAYFPIVPSRNTHIVAALKQLRSQGLKLNRSPETESQSFYLAYLDLAHGAAKKLSIPAWQIEMALFARGPVLADEAK